MTTRPSSPLIVYFVFRANWKPKVSVRKARTFSQLRKALETLRPGQFLTLFDEPPTPRKERVQ